MYVVEFPINPDYFLYKIKRLVINLQNKNKIFTMLKMYHKLSIQNEWINFPMSTYILFTQYTYVYKNIFLCLNIVEKKMKVDSKR